MFSARPVTAVVFSPVSPLINPETDAVILRDSCSALLEVYKYGFRVTQAKDIIF
jgi:hypothetical protein